MAAPVSELFHPELVRTNSYGRAMKAGAATLDFSAVVFTAPDISGTTKHFTAVVAKGDGDKSFGFAVGTLKDGTHLVHHVKPGSLTDAVLEVDDELDIVNNETAAKLSHDELINVLGKSTALSLSITRENEHYMDVVLEKVNGTYGVSLGSQDKSHLFVSDVLPDGPGSGKLFVGDVIVALNTRLIGTLTHQEVIDAIATHEKTRFTVIRSEVAKKQVAEQLEGQHAIGIIYVNITKEHVDASFGIGIGDTTDGGQVITKTSDAAAADGLMVADEIVEINDVSIAGKSHEDVLGMMTGETDLKLKLHRQLKYSLDPSRRITGAITQIDGQDITNITEMAAVKTPEAIPNEIVTLERGTFEDEYGFKFGTLDDQVKLVTNVTKESLADGKLAANDELVKINGLSCMDHDHDELVAVMVKGLKLEIEVLRGDGTRSGFEAQVITRRASVGLATHKPAVLEEEVTVARPDDESSYGFGLGTADDGHAYVTEIKEGGLAAAAGLKHDDEIWKIDGVEVTGKDHNDIVELLITKLSVAITIRREADDGSPVHHVLHKFIHERANLGSAQTKETIIVKVERDSLETGFGFGIGTLEDGGQVITKVSDAREAEDLIRVADEIMTCNGHAASTMSHDDLIAAISGTTSVEMAISRVVKKGHTIKAEHGATVATEDSTDA